MRDPRHTERTESVFSVASVLRAPRTAHNAPRTAFFYVPRPSHILASNIAMPGNRIAPAKVRRNEPALIE